METHPAQNVEDHDNVVLQQVDAILNSSSDNAERNVTTTMSEMNVDDWVCKMQQLDWK